jgi:hypothetical protein
MELESLGYAILNFHVREEVPWFELQTLVAKPYIEAKKHS